jgi:hypothetical protein
VRQDGAPVAVHHTQDIDFYANNQIGTKSAVELGDVRPIRPGSL